MNQEALYRYSRQIRLDEFGSSGQIKLKKASVLIVGIGGLGCPAAQYLAAAGIGTLGLMDGDVVELSNLHRQILFTGKDIGKNKAIVAKDRLSAVNPDVHIRAFNYHLNNQNALSVFSEFDLIVDGTDQLFVRYIINDACHLLNKPWIYASIYKMEGQLSVFNFTDNKGIPGPDYRSLFPDPPDPSTIATCNETGVIGPLPGVMGTLQAAEAIKILSGMPGLLQGKLLIFDLSQMNCRTFEFSRNKHADRMAPNSVEAFESFNYEHYCHINQSVPEISCKELSKFKGNPILTVYDTRKNNESDVLQEFSAIRIAEEEILNSAEAAAPESINVIVCDRGISSAKLVSKAIHLNPNCKFYSLKGGAEAWKNYRYELENTHG